MFLSVFASMFLSNNYSGNILTSFSKDTLTADMQTDTLSDDKTVKKHIKKCEQPPRWTDPVRVS